MLLGEEGELADRLRKAIAKMKKLDDKLASVTKVCVCVCMCASLIVGVSVGMWVGGCDIHLHTLQRERELKRQRKLLEQQLAMLEAGTAGVPPLGLEYKGEGLGEGLEADSDG